VELGALRRGGKHPVRQPPEDFGIHVTYGVVGLKTHCKVVLVIRQDFNGLRRYAHIGTGNYHPGTARLYSDFGLLTCDDAIGQDLTELFNYLTTGYRPKRAYHKLLPAPTALKKALLQKIEREIAHQAAGTPALIQMKMNALEDVDVTRALYLASQAGVQVNLIVRDTCRLRPGIAGLSDTVRVVSVVGRFSSTGGSTTSATAARTKGSSARPTAWGNREPRGGGRTGGGSGAQAGARADHRCPAGAGTRRVGDAGRRDVRRDQRRSPQQPARAGRSRGETPEGGRPAAQAEVARIRATSREVTVPGGWTSRRH
jgi:hypothetical protein